MAQAKPFPVDPYLTSIAIAYQNPANSYIADLILPKISVPKREFKYLTYPKGQLFTVPETLVGRKSIPNEVDFSSSQAYGGVTDYGLDDVVPLDDVNEASGTTLNPINDAVEGLTELLTLDREVRVATMLNDASNYGGNTTAIGSTSGDKWDDSGSNPLSVIKDILTNMFVRPNTIVMSNKLWNVLSAHPTIITALYGVNRTTGTVSTQQLAQLLEVQNIYVGTSWINSVNPGQGVTLKRVWNDDNLIMLYINSQANTQRGITFGYTAEYMTRFSGRIQEPKIGLKGGVRVRVGESLGEFVTCQDAGYLITATLSS